ncbi:MAG: AraC family transcriptional regulator [Clostridiales bacterium]|jgi:AraC-like DNA-binding protein|nr:AraC family transcriptional regulator [Clostridiales bacterium]
MNTQLFEALAQTTPEERADGGAPHAVDRALYMTGKRNTISAQKLLASGELITTHRHPRYVHFPAHTHEFVELVYMCAGQTDHIVNDKRVTLRTGELLILNRHAVQEILPAGEGDVAVNFIVLPAFFDTALGMLGSENSALRSFLVSCLRRDARGTGYLHFKVADVLPVQNLVENLLWTLVRGEPNRSRVDKTTMGLLFLHLQNHADKIESGNAQDDLTFKVLQYVDEHYADGSLTALAELLFHDLCWLSRAIKRLTGKTFQALMRARRFAQARFLLDTTDLTVTDVATAVGYDNFSYFHRVFMQTYGCTPKHYRRRDCK